ncbi:MAG TPA: lipopolysaccharide heptosyltransferase II [Candidatus Edwardsbacteria bacterium]|nr:lipopolysaccharide heptosyltransferase II [Candidatus Edwardsbacteria bacterium]
MSERSANILVRAPNWIGDAVMATGFIAALRRSAPDARISVLAHQRVAALFDHGPHIAEVIAFERNEPLWLTAARLRNKRYGCCYVLPLSLSSALIAALAGIPARVGYDSEWRGMFLSRSLPYDKRAFRARHLIEDYLALLGDGAAVAPPEVYLAEDEIKWAQQWLAQRGLEGRRVIGFGPGAAYGPAKRWPAARWIELGRRLKDAGARVLIFGSLDESRLCKEIERNIGTTAVSLAGGTDLRQSAALIAHCVAFVTNDTGVMHLAAAVGTKTMALFGSTKPAWTRPWGAGHAVLYAHEPCSPCYQRTCRFGHYNCLNKLTVDSVWDILQQ